MGYLTNFILTIMFLVSLCFIGYSVWLFIRINSMRPLSGDRIINFKSNRTGKRATGILMKWEDGAGGRIKLTYMPDDIDFDNKNYKDLKEIEPVTIITELSRLAVYPRGTLSQEMGFLFIIPEHSRAMSEFMKRDILGNGIMRALESTDVLKSELDLRDETISRLQHLAPKTAPALSRLFVDNVENYQSDVKRILATEKDKINPYTPLSKGGASYG